MDNKKLNLNQSVMMITNKSNNFKNKKLFAHLSSNNFGSCSNQIKSKKIIKSKELNYEKIIPRKKLTEKKILTEGNRINKINSSSNLSNEKNNRKNISEIIISKEDIRNISSRNFKPPFLVNCIYGKSNINSNKDPLNQSIKTSNVNDSKLCSLLDYQACKCSIEKLSKKKEILSNDIINKTMINKNNMSQNINNKSNVNDNINIINNNISNNVNNYINNTINNNINNFEKIKVISVNQLSNSKKKQKNKKIKNDNRKPSICNNVYQKVPKFKKISQTGKTITQCISSRRNLINNIITNDKNNNHLMVNYNIIDIKNNINNINNNSTHYCFNNYLLNDSFNTFNDDENSNRKNTIINIDNEDKYLTAYINEKNLGEKLNIKEKLKIRSRNVSSGNLNRTYIININNKNVNIPKLQGNFKKIDKIKINNNYNNDTLIDSEKFEKINQSNTPNKADNNLIQENLIVPRTTRNSIKLPISFYSKKNMDKCKTIFYTNIHNLKKNINNKDNLNEDPNENVNKNINSKKNNHYKTISDVGINNKIHNYTNVKNDHYKNKLKMNKKNLKKEIFKKICYNTDNNLTSLNSNNNIIENKCPDPNRISKLKQYENNIVSNTIETKNNINNNFTITNSDTNSEENFLSPKIYKKPSNKIKLIDFVNENSTMRKSINTPASKIINTSAKTREIKNMLLSPSNGKIIQYNRLEFFDNEYANKSQTKRNKFIISSEVTNKNNSLISRLNNEQSLYEFSNFEIKEKYKDYYNRNSFMTKMYCYAIKIPKMSPCIYTKDNNNSYDSIIKKPLIYDICHFSKKIKKSPRTPKFYNSFYIPRNSEVKNDSNSINLSNIEKGLNILDRLINKRVVNIYDIGKGIKSLISVCGKKNSDTKEDNSYLNETHSSNFSFKTNLKFDNKLKNIFHGKINTTSKKPKNPIINIQLNKKSKYKNIIENDSITDINNICSNFHCELMNLLNALAKNNFSKILANVEESILLNKKNEVLFTEKIHILIDLIFDKASNEICYSFLYAKLLNELNIKLFNEFFNKNNCKINKDKNFKLLINEECDIILNDYKNLPEEFFIKKKNKFFGFLFFIDELIKFELVKQQYCFHVFNQIYQKYNNEISNEKKNIFLEGGVILLNNIGKNIVTKKNKKYINILNEIINEVFTNLLKENESTKKIPSHLKYKIINIIEKHKNNWKNSLYEQSINFKNYHTNSYLYSMDINNKNLLLNFENIEKKEEEEYNDDVENMIKNDLLKYLINNIEYNFEIIDNLINDKKINLSQIIIYYAKSCKEIVNNENYIKKANDYIVKIVEYLNKNITKQEIDFIHFGMIKFFNNINKAIGSNKFMYKILGNLLFILLSKGYYHIKDFNQFIKDEEKETNYEAIINLAIITRYCIIFSGYLAKKYYNDFKQTKLFIINNGIFTDYVTGMLNDYLYYTK